MPRPMAEAVRLTTVHTMRRLTWSAWGALTLLVAPVLWAQPQVLTWEAPADCPTQEDVLAAVQEITGPEVYGRTTLHAAGRIRQVNGSFRLEIGVEGEHGVHERTIEAKVCGDLLGAAAVVLGLNLKRQADAAPDSAAPGPDETGTPTTDAPAAKETDSPTTAGPAASSGTSNPNVPPPSVDDMPRVDDVASENNMWIAVPQVHVSVGSLPAPSVQWSAGVGWRSPDWLVWLSGRYQPAQTVESRSAPGVGAEVSRVAAEVGLARGFRGEHFEWAPGVLLGMDYLMVSGAGEDIEAADASSMYPFVVASVSLRWLIARWFSVAAQIGAELPLSRPRLMVDELGEVGQLGPVSGRLSVGSEWNF